MGGRGVASKGKVPSMVSSSEHPQLCATWTQADIKTLLNYVEENQPKAAIAGGSGLAYSSEKGANVVTEAGQLVMDEHLETCPKAGQFQSKGFKCLECMQQFVPPDKARGTNVHHAAGAGTTTQTSHIFRSTSSSCSICSQSAFAPPVQYPPIISATIPITIPITIPTTSHPQLATIHAFCHAIWLWAPSTQWSLACTLSIPVHHGFSLFAAICHQLLLGLFMATIKSQVFSAFNIIPDSAMSDNVTMLNYKALGANATPFLMELRQISHSHVINIPAFTLLLTEVNHGDQGLELNTAATFTTVDMDEPEQPYSDMYDGPIHPLRLLKGQDTSLAEPVLCSMCCIDVHQLNPFHKIEKWAGTFFEDYSLRLASFIMHLGHGGKPCPCSGYPGCNISPSMEDEWEDMDTAGHPPHLARPEGCSCLTISGIVIAMVPRAHSYIQLLRAGLFPVTMRDFRTSLTVHVLDDFLWDNVECGTSAMNYYSKIQRMTSSTFPHLVSDRYRELLRVSRAWRNLKLLKWKGFYPGSCNLDHCGLVLFCPTCPQPGINILEMDDVELSHWKYSCAIVMDGNFKAEHLAPKNAGNETWLMDGQGYMVASQDYKTYLGGTKKQDHGMKDIISIMLLLNLLEAFQL
ncbi:hypothetical protein EDC04DRAFT_2603277 [Pisolithus marmoratus]|nr:hypothetical protein EDC04DRAFT_2603277 [Pisolithus marmoratus]